MSCIPKHSFSRNSDPAERIGILLMALGVAVVAVSLWTQPGGVNDSWLPMAGLGTAIAGVVIVCYGKAEGHNS